MKNLIIFDLDGTLLNTIADLAESTNYVLNKLGFPVHEEKAYNFMVGNGINKLFERALPEGEKTEKNILRIRKEFLVYYSRYNTVKSRPYPGIPELLDTLNDSGKKMAVASNKYHEGTRKLIDFYFPGIPFISVLGQREGIPPKPDPAIVMDIIRETNFSKDGILYVGDSGVDMQTAINAGVTSCGVKWGFRPEEELKKYNPDYIINRPEDILRII